MFDEVWPAEVAAGLAETDCAVLTDERLVDCMSAAAALVAWAESYGLQALAELRRRRHADHVAVLAELHRSSTPLPADAEEVDRFCAAEVSVVLRLSHRAAVDRVALADDLVSRLPSTLASMGTGRLGLAQARTIRDGVEVLDLDTARAVEADVLPVATASTPSQLAARVRRRVTAADAGAAARRCVEARRSRRVSTWALDDGVAALQVTGPAETVAAAWARVDGLARCAQDAARVAARELAREQGDGRGDDGVPTLDQLRADTVLRLLAGTHDLTELPSPHVDVSLDVLVPLGTLLGASDEPGELSGHGPLPAEVVRALAVDARWRAVVLAADGSVATPCTTGAPTAHGPTTYRPSAQLEAAIRARDVTCRFPSCRRAARRCDVDHTVPYPAGPTAACNLACLCRMHHRLKHRAGWRLEQLGDGRLRWTTPAGLTVTTSPPRWDPPARPPPPVPPPTGDAPDLGRPGVDGCEMGDQCGPAVR